MANDWLEMDCAAPRENARVGTRNGHCNTTVGTLHLRLHCAIGASVDCPGLRVEVLCDIVEPVFEHVVARLDRDGDRWSHGAPHVGRFQVGVLRLLLGDLWQVHTGAVVIGGDAVLVPVFGLGRDLLAAGLRLRRLLSAQGPQERGPGGGQRPERAKRAGQHICNM